MSNVKWRSGIAATGFAAVIFVGTITGAQLKTDKQKKEVRFSCPDIIVPGVRVLTMVTANRSIQGDAVEGTDNRAGGAEEDSCWATERAAARYGYFQGKGSEAG